MVWRATTNAASPATRQLPASLISYIIATSAFSTFTPSYSPSGAAPPPRPHPYRIIQLANLLRSRLSPSSTHDTYSTLYLIRQLNMALSPLPNPQPLRYGMWDQKWIWSLPATTALNGLLKIHRDRSRGVAGTGDMSEGRAVLGLEERRLIEVLLRNAVEWDLQRAAERPPDVPSPRTPTSIPPLLLNTALTILLRSATRNPKSAPPLLIIVDQLESLSFPLSFPVRLAVFRTQLDSLRRPDLAAQALLAMIKNAKVSTSSSRTQLHHLVKALSESTDGDERRTLTQHQLDAITVLARDVLPLMERKRGYLRESTQTRDMGDMASRRQDWSREIEMLVKFLARHKVPRSLRMPELETLDAVDQALVSHIAKLVQRDVVLRGPPRGRYIHLPSLSDRMRRTRQPSEIRLSDTALASLIRFSLNRLSSPRLARSLLARFRTSTRESPVISNLSIILAPTLESRLSLAASADLVNDRTLPSLLRTLNPTYDVPHLLLIINAIMPDLFDGSETPPPTDRSVWLYVVVLHAVAKAGKVGLAERVFRRLRWGVVLRRQEKGGEAAVVPKAAFVIMLQLYAAERRKQGGKMVKGWGRTALRWSERQRRKEQFPSLRPPRVSAVGRGEETQVERREAAKEVAVWELWSSSREKQEREMFERAAKSWRGRQAVKTLMG